MNGERVQHGFPGVDPPAGVGSVLPPLGRHQVEHFQGCLLGLTNLQLTDNRDGVRTYALQSTPDIADRQAALAEWQAYLAGLAK